MKKREDGKRKTENVLFAVVGFSPAILTETVWALAREGRNRIPTRVVTVTTAAGREKIVAELLDSGVWDDLVRSLKTGGLPEFGNTGAHIRVITRGARELDDIRTPEDNAAAADFILHELRAFADEGPETRIIATIAGGRKTMSALLYACISLVGRETDRVTHVLVDERLEQRRNPRFYFPRNRAEEKAIQLADIPFVPLRNRFAELGERAGTFSRLVARYGRELRSEAAREAMIGFTERGVSIDGVEVPLRGRDMFVLRFLVELNMKGAVKRQDEAESDFREFVGRHDPEWARNLVYPDDLKRTLSHVRKVHAARGVTWAPGLRHDSLRLPPFRLA